MSVPAVFIWRSAEERLGRRSGCARTKSVRQISGRANGSRLLGLPLPALSEGAPRRAAESDCQNLDSTTRFRRHICRRFSFADTDFFMAVTYSPAASGFLSNIGIGNE